MLEKELQDRLLFICQLGSSKQELDKEVYNLLTNTRSKKDFGSAPHYGNQPNTGIAALAGAVDKLRRGDLSQKQIEHIAPTLEVLAKAYPHKFSELTFVEREMVQVKVQLQEHVALLLLLVRLQQHQHQKAPLYLLFLLAASFHIRASRHQV